MFIKTDDNNNNYFSRLDIEQNPTYIKNICDNVYKNR